MVRRQSEHRLRNESCEALIFKSLLGWFGILTGDRGISDLVFGYRSKLEVLNRLQCGSRSPTVREGRWIDLICRYSCGDDVSLAKIPVDFGGVTPFRARILEACRGIGRGETLTYGQLARVAGSPAACRAVGTAMSSNRVPILVPCHRVIASNGLGGYSSHLGLEIKKKLLRMEGAKLSGL